MPRSPWRIPFGFVYDHDGGWDECNERLATVIVCEFLYWGGH